MKVRFKFITLWKAFWIVVLFLCFGIAKAFKAFGIEFHTIAHQWRIVLFLFAAFLGVAVVVLQQKEKAGKAYFVRIEFNGARRPAPGMELNLKAQNEEDARAQAQQVAEDYLGQRQLMGAVQAWVAEVKCR